MPNVAVVLAAGLGLRVGGDTPKQFLPLDGRPVVAHSIDAFQQADGIDEICVVVHPSWRGCMQAIASEYGWSKLRKVVDGGDERYLSSLNAIAAFLDYPDSTNLLFHDAARPWLSQAVIARVLDALRLHEAVGVAVPSTDTVWEVRPDFQPSAEVSRFVARIPDRRTMWRAQTPQAFRLPLIRDAYQCALQDPRFQATDDCGVVRHYLPSVKIHVVEGEERNRKITFPSDLQGINV